MNYYYLNGAGEVTGPVSEATLAELHKIGRLTETTQVCMEGTEEWIELRHALSDPEQECQQTPTSTIPTQPKPLSSRRKGKLAAVLMIVVAVVGGGGLLVKNLDSTGNNSADTQTREPQGTKKLIVENVGPGGASAIGVTEPPIEPEEADNAYDPKLPDDIAAVIHECQQRIHQRLVEPPTLWPPGKREREEAAARADSLVQDALIYTKMAHENAQRARSLGIDTGPVRTFEQILWEREDSYLWSRKHYPASLALTFSADQLVGDARLEAQSIVSAFKARDSTVEHKALEFLARDLLVREGALDRNKFVIPKSLGTMHPSQKWSAPTKALGQSAAPGEEQRKGTLETNGFGNPDTLIEYYSDLGLSEAEITRITEFSGGKPRTQEPAELFNLLAGLYEMRPDFDGDQCVRWLVKAAEAGSAEAMYRLHQILHPYFPFANVGYPRGDEDESRYWAQKSAEYGSGEGMIAMGFYYWYGSYNHDGTRLLMEPDRRKAVDWWTQAAKHDSSGHSSEAKSILDYFRSEVDALADSESSAQGQPEADENNADPGSAWFSLCSIQWDEAKGSKFFENHLALDSSIDVGGKVYKNMRDAIDFHAPGTIRYAFDHPITGFQAKGFIRPSRLGKIAFVIITDHGEVFRSDPVKKGSQPVDISLDLKPTLTLTLSIDPLGEAHEDYGFWLDPQIRSAHLSNVEPTPEKQPTAATTPTPTPTVKIDEALPALKIFQRASLGEAQECVRLLDEQLTIDPGNSRIETVKNTILDIFREEASLVSAKERYQKAEKLVEVETKNLQVSSRPRLLDGRINQNEVAKYKRRLSAAQSALRKIKSEGTTSRTKLQRLLNKALGSLPPEESEILSPVWRQIAQRNGLKLSK